MNLYTWRKFKNRLALGVAMLAISFGLFWLFWILIDVFKLGVASMSLRLFTEMTPAPGSEGLCLSYHAKKLDRCVGNF